MIAGPKHRITWLDAHISHANARLIAAAPETAAERDKLKADLAKAAKLRDQYMSANVDACKERDKLKAINAELLAALKRLCDQIEAQPEKSAVLVPYGAVRRGLAAIAKAQPST